MTSSFPDEPFTVKHRQEFPSLANKAYFNYGGQGPLSRRSLEAIANSYQQVQKLGPFSNRVNEWIIREQSQTREAIATELGVPTSTLSLTEDVSVGCNIALWGIDWQKGDHLLLTDCEHPGIVAAVREISRRFNVEVSYCPVMATLNGGNPTEVIAKVVRPTTRLVVISHLLWNTGQLLPQAEIVKACKAANSTVKILSDAAQSVGSVPVNLREDGIDFYAFTGHKWLCGPEGLGGLYVSPEARESLLPTFIGWRSVVLNNSGHPTGWQPDGRRYEIATSAYPLLAGLREAIAVHSAWGTPQLRFEKICQLSEYLWRQLVELPEVICLRESPPGAGLISFQLTNKKHPQLVQFLEDRDIMVRTIRDPDCVRACVHYFTSKSEIDRLVVGIEAFCKST